MKGAHIYRFKVDIEITEEIGLTKKKFIAGIFFFLTKICLKYKKETVTA